MLKILKNSYNHTNKYIILATPLILFSLISSLYLLFSLSGNTISQLCASILLFLMFTAFLAGWFYMVMFSIKNDDVENPNSLLKEFASGVGEYFLPVIGLAVNTIVTILIFMFVAYFIGMKLIGNAGISAVILSKALTSVETMKTFLTTLSPEQLVKLNLWNLLFFAVINLTYFIIMFYPPALFYKTKNPFKAVFLGLRDLFSRKILGNILLFVLIFGFYLVISILSTIFSYNIVMHFVFTLINFYYMVFAIVCIFNYYYSNFVKVGSNIDTTV